ncbi:MAG: hypothetical protein AB1635_02215 [Acidobacteriota bacterium]
MDGGVVAERRAAERQRPEDAGWQRDAVLRPGRLVEVRNLSWRGALVASGTRMLPGSRAELHLWRQSHRRVRRGTIVRCIVCSLAPLRYEGAVAFDDDGPEERREGSA